MATSGIMVTLSSDGSNFKFLNNKMSSYKILLPCPLELNEQWEVGLGDINLPEKKPGNEHIERHEHFFNTELLEIILETMWKYLKTIQPFSVTCVIKVFRGAFPGIKNFMLHVK